MQGWLDFDILIPPIPVIQLEPPVHKWIIPDPLYRRSQLFKVVQPLGPLGPRLRIRVYAAPSRVK